MDCQVVEMTLSTSASVRNVVMVRRQSPSPEGTAAAGRMRKRMEQVRGFAVGASLGGGKFAYGYEM